ncbi:MAG: PAS domain S-box protein [Paludibacter sp.]|nr:PAS domain S-box protein [Paludibacter sp.]
MKTTKFSLFRNIKFEYKITLSYLLFGLLWILFSDKALDLLANDDSLLTQLQTYKGAFFILTTSVFLYFFVKRHMYSLKLTETKLLESESHYKALFNNNHSVIILINPENARIEDANPAACAYYGWTHAELCNMKVYDFNISDLETVKVRLHAVVTEELNHLFVKHRLANGEIRDVEVFSNPIRIRNKNLIYSSIHDITEQRNAESELRKLSKAVEQSPVGICITNPAGMIEYVNPKVIELTGFSAEELMNENTRIFSSGEKPNQEYTKLWQTIQSGNVWSGEFHNRKKNGELYWEAATISPIFNTAGAISHFLAIKEDITDRKRAEIALNESEELLRKFASHLQNVREEEKVALSREIHDDLGQTLVALKIDMGLLKNKIIKFNTTNDPKDISQGFDDIVNLIDKTIKTARRIMSGLRPELLEMNGFSAAATSYLTEFENRHRIGCEFISDISGIEMNPQQSLVFFRILQESLNNIAKHSKAKTVKVYLRSENNKIILEVIDNGVGFDKNNSGRQDSYGMLGMKERAVLLKGNLEIESEIGKGSRVRVEIPHII